MTDWLAPMQQSFEYYTVNPGTWTDVKRLTTVTKASITRDLSADTLGSASFSMDEFDDTEAYVRVYLVTVQNGREEKFPLGTFLVQSPATSFDGTRHTLSMDAYTPLIELKENQPPLGYFVRKASNIMDMVSSITEDNLRAPVVPQTSAGVLYDDFVANTDDTWITFIRDLALMDKHDISLDEMGRVLFAPQQELVSLQPVWAFDDSNSSILYPEIDVDHDIYGVPNVIEVVYSGKYDTYFARVENNDPNSPTSIQARGRVISMRITDASFPGEPTEGMVQRYAEDRLKAESTLTYTVSYTHGYCPVRVGDCVRLNYDRAGLRDIKARVISQTIECEPGCPVKETATFTQKLWG